MFPLFGEAKRGTVAHQRLRAQRWLLLDIHQGSEYTTRSHQALVPIRYNEQL
jgi:hypothetical protein